MRARSAGTIVQALLDGTIPPMPFNQTQCADLKDWDGDTETQRLAQARGQRRRARRSRRRRRKPSIASARRTSVCVLPFQNMSGDPEQEYFSDGISEDITTDLSKVSALEVIARNTAFTFKGQAVDVCDVARKLGVSHVLEGSVRKAGNRVRVTAQLIDGSRRRPRLGRPLRSRPDGHLRDPGRNFAGHRRCAARSSCCRQRRRRSRIAARRMRTPTISS